MARPGLTKHPKFLRLVFLLGEPSPHVLGHLEFLWASAYECGEDEIGDSVAVELTAGWDGEPGRFIKALLECGGEGHSGFIDACDGEPDRYRIHDLYDHAPEYVRKRMDREALRRQRGKTLSEIRSEAARKRWEKVQMDATGGRLNANGCMRQSQAPCEDANGTTPAPAPAPLNPPIVPQGTTDEITSTTRARKSKKASPDEYTSAFEEFWSAYPPLRKTSKRAAWAAWRAAVTRSMPAVILEAVRAFAASPKGRGRFCPGPAPWLNQDRWEDDRAAWQDSGEDSRGPHEPVDIPFKEYF